ncbi:MAG: TOBE domain-containing protein [Methylococcaceae bacterium]|nr:TOBE domain-containing protein [Methylococcaceae bacterium]
MPKNSNDSLIKSWVEGELRLGGTLDSRMIGLLRAIDQSGSINQAAKQVDLSYKGAWQMIERANNFAPKVLISTATGGSKGGGTKLTAAGLALLKLFTRLEQQHNAFLQQLNQSLAEDPDIQLLMKRLVIKTSATNQLFGTLVSIECSSINVEVVVKLKGGEKINASLALSEFRQLDLQVGSDVLLLINATEIMIATKLGRDRWSARNFLHGFVIRVQYDGVDSEIVIQLPGGESLAVTVTQISAELLDLKPGVSAYALFNSNAVILGQLLNESVETLANNS